MKATNYTRRNNLCICDEALIIGYDRFGRTQEILWLKNA